MIRIFPDLWGKYPVPRMLESISRTLLESVGDPPVSFLCFCFTGVKGGEKVALRVSSNSERWFII